ncbi:RDD family protein [Dactylosporangium roseum]|uniref:RDD family protein n=1 Tax=Dactylosporangium roseum TaxID=47989 RepID=A0ABY5ZET1_9ACTN|nr:RDD family protein [Dactylosporangium roseum]
MFSWVVWAAVELTPAPLARRFGALLIDWLLCLLIAGAIADPVREPWIAPGILVVEYALFLGFFGQTVGMKLMRIRVVSIVTGGVIGVPRALLRGIVLLPLVTALILDRQQRGLHDKAAGSIVVPTEPTPQ